VQEERRSTFKDLPYMQVDKESWRGAAAAGTL
jgi:hypothetical protein